MDFYKTLEEIMNEKNMSIPEVARACGLSDGTVRSIVVRKSQNVSLEVAFKLSAGLGVSLERLNGDTPKSEKTAPPEFSDEAKKIAKDYDKLTDHGKGLVKVVLGYEEKALSHYSQQEDGDGKLVTLPKSRRSGPMVQIRVYDQPAAAGLGNYLDEPAYHVEQYPPSVIPAQTDFGVVISGDSMEPKVHNGGTVFVQAAPNIEPGKIGIFVLNGQAYCKKLVVEQESRTVRLVSLNPKYEDIVVDEDSDTFRTLGRVLGQWTPGHKQDLFGW